MLNPVEISSRKEGEDKPFSDEGKARESVTIRYTLKAAKFVN